MGMTGKDVRKANLLNLLAGWRGTQGEWAKEAGISEVYLSQLVTGYRGVGERVARRIEERLGLPRGWLDLPRPGGETLAVGATTIPILRPESVKEFLVSGVVPVGSACLEVAGGVGERAFALEVEGDALAPEIGRGSHLIVEPGYAPRAGSVVVALVNGAVIVRRLLLDGPYRVLAATQPQYPSRVMEDGDLVLGVVVAVQRRLEP